MGAAPCFETRQAALLSMRPTEAAPYILLRLLVGIDHLAGLVFGRRHHDLRGHILELGDVVALDVLELDLQHPRLRPFRSARRSAPTPARRQASPPPAPGWRLRWLRVLIYRACFFLPLVSGSGPILSA